MSRRLVDQIMLMVARKCRGEGDELRSALVNPALAVVSALAELLASGRRRDRRPGPPGLPQVVEQLRGMADLLESMTPAGYGSRG